ncbi:undecaprenyl-diphosphate phosphatase [Candidatus Vesicomyidisocius calyptogenae]|uniref:Undecaprenyl-diphosphatase n=1 Tax=Vesicomyosocius okutanii subsp. Calyptogena okutanii (strain HA) TaxID=412965 RepID=UPPP_VESOH|nr:undecaprenyl-diphosphate phosphatase [Candidatus Vesicomyosocius okutanii]A5CWY7.1 RecName: Full=Undecaprenyl-diphosphatase; AltName: Full=Bacitracin resistance protein; AltName: Full=Undecaprenyl pyrophosphate phosphatase [Candidatus Vesicomyosocius okutanii]BAF61528.1 undecaprenol kinase [Candidatus Vesicomyosocius okutanii]
MDVSQTIVLALIQGLSEFLPISSSAHLILVPKLTNWTDQGLIFDVVVHMGTLSAVIFYYQAMIRSLFFDFYYSIIKRQIIGQSKLAWGVLLGTIPIGLVGMIFKDFVAVDLRSIEIIAYTTLVFGLLLGFASWFNHKNKNPKSTISWIDVSFVSMMQILALIPGTSRSGITITACMLVGLSRKLSIQFSFLLSIPVITLSLILMLIDLYHQTQLVNVSLLVLGFVISTISAYATIIFVIRLIDMVGMTPFVIYRLILGVFLFFL